MLHIHAAVFLVMTLDLCPGLMSRWLPGSSALSSCSDIAAACYAIWCVYRAMRRYYVESRVGSLAKLALIGIAYQIFLVVMVATTLLLSALTS